MARNEQTNAFRAALYAWDERLTKRHPEAALYSPELRERFWSRTTPDPESGCLLWTGTLDVDGYPTMEGPNGKCKASRVGMELMLGRKLARGTFVCRKPVCRRLECVNPGHQFISKHSRVGGTGRQRVCLTPVQVIAIRAALRGGVTRTELARRYGCTGANITSIALGQTWKGLL